MGVVEEGEEGNPERRESDSENIQQPISRVRSYYSEGNFTAVE